MVHILKGYEMSVSGAFDSTRLVDSCGKPWSEHPRCHRPKSANHSPGILE